MEFTFALFGQSELRLNRTAMPTLNTDCGFLSTCSHYDVPRSCVYDQPDNSFCPKQTLFLVFSHNRL